MTPSIDLSRSEIRSIASFLESLIAQHPSRTLEGLAREHGLCPRTLRKFMASRAAMRMARKTLESIAGIGGPLFNVELLLRRPAPGVARAPVTPQRVKRVVRRPQRQ